MRNLATLSDCGDDSDPGVAGPSATATDDAGEPTSAPGSPWLGGRFAGETGASPNGPVPDAIGPYRILTLLGEGGMGVVYRAQQTGLLRRDVALKIVKRGIDTDRVVDRFERERRVLARLDHPNIARVFDAGATADGRPYFVMELVLGERVTTYCDGHRLDVDARLAIFLDICQAVRHAHQRGVLHRDLKPSNVLVAPVDGRPVPKVIDFGIAKVMDDTDDHGALDTQQSGQAIGTPAYMSPEQAGRIDTGVDTRTDVYSLGVLLYELLTGHHPRDYAPHDPHSTSGGRRPSEAVVLTLTPPRGAIPADALADRRQSTPQRLRRRLAGDLDTVVLKAIELEPDRRYDSVEQFADDVRRVIAGEPVRAKPPTWMYRTRRFVRRHRVSVAAAVIGVLVVAGGTGVLGWQRVELARERDRAREAERRAGLDAQAANQVTDFLIGLFEVANPDQAGGRVMTAREMLDEGAARVRTELQDAPPVKARLLTAMGGAYMGLRQDDVAERLLQDALSMRDSMRAEPDRQLFESLQHLSRIQARRGDVTAALAYSRRAGEVAARLESVPARYHSELWNNLALIQMQAGEFEPARQTLERALALSLQQRLDDPARKDGRIHHNLGSVLYELGRLDEAAAQFAQAEAAFRRAGPASKDLRANLVAAASARGLVLRDLKRPDEARTVLDAGVGEARQVYREPHPALATILNNLALVEQDQKDYAGAETHFREVLQIDRAVSGERHADVASDLHNLAWFLHKYRGRSAEAEQVSRQAVAMRRDLLGAAHPHTASSVRQLADILSGRGQYAAARHPLYRESLRVQTAALPRGHRLTLLAALGLGEALTALGQRAEAVRVLGDALATAPVQTPPAKIRVELEAALAKARTPAATRAAGHSIRGPAMRRLALAFVVVSTVVTALAGQQPSQPPAPAPAQTPTPTLRASVDQVVVDVVVTDAGGAIVPGLTAADFEIREDGAPQPIVTFSEVVLPFERREPGAAAPPPAEVRSNRAMAEGRVYLLLLDDLFVMASRTPSVQQVARDFIGRYVQPGDLVAVTTTGGMAGTSQAFTEDMSLVARAVDRFVGKKSRSAAVEKLEQAYRARELDPLRTRRAGNANTPFNRDGAVLGVNAIDDEVLDRGRVALRTVKNAVQSMTSVAGRRKTVVYLSEGVDIPLGPGDSTEIAREVHAILGQAARANVAVYAISPRGLHGMGDEMTELRALPTGQTGPIGANYTLSDIQKEQRIADTMLRTVAEGTGGIALVDANQLTTGLDRIVAESSHYYLLGYTPPNPKRDGKYRTIDIALRQPGLHATARKGYAAPDDREARAEPLKGLPPELGALLRQPLPAAGLPLAAHAVAFPTATDNVSVTVEIGAGALAFTPKGDKRFNALDVAILPVDASGRTHGLTQGHPQLTLPPEMADTVVAKGLRLSHRLTLAPGEYQLRVGVRETGGGATGSVLCDLVVPDPALPGLTMTPIVASASSAITVPSAYNDPGLLWALGGPPTTARAFDRADTLSAYVELVDAGAAAVRDIDILTVVRDARGRDVVRSPQPKANGRVAAGRSFAYAVDLPLKALAPGRYVLRIEARASGLPEPLARELTFDVRTEGP